MSKDGISAKDRANCVTEVVGVVAQKNQTFSDSYFFGTKNLQGGSSGDAIKSLGIAAGIVAIGGCLAAEPCGYLLGLGMLAEGDITALAGAGALKSTVSISSLRATHGRTMSNGQMKKLVKDIQTNGINEPLTVTNYNNTLYVLDGNNRLIAAPKAGISEVPVNYVELPWGAYKTPNDLVFSPGGL